MVWTFEQNEEWKIVQYGISMGMSKKKWKPARTWGEKIQNTCRKRSLTANLTWQSSMVDKFGDQAMTSDAINRFDEKELNYCVKTKKIWQCYLDKKRYEKDVVTMVKKMERGITN